MTRPPASSGMMCPGRLAILALALSLPTCTLDTVVTRAIDDCDGASCLCDPGWDRCEGVCRDTRVDPRHCGTCTHRCGAGERCVSGECVCRPGLVRCSGACVDPTSDAKNCGGCDAPCSGPAPYCAGSACGADSCDAVTPAAASCGIAQTSCVPDDLLPDHPLHCGGCDVRCAADEVCVAGQCRAYVPRGECQSCPCAGCGGDLCCDSEEIGAVICLPDAPSCPG